MARPVDPSHARSGNHELWVRLCRGALDIVEGTRILGGGSQLLVPSVRRGKPFASTALSELLSGLGIATVPHGSGSSPSGLGGRGAEYVASGSCRS